MAHDKYKKDCSDLYVREASLEEIFETADIVSLHLPLTDETHYYADTAFFAKFKKPIYFVNTSRGKNTDTGALVEALKSGSVVGACLDVIEYEKISLQGLESDKQTNDLKHLIEAKNVILSPHIAGLTQESYYKLSDVLAEKILKKYVL